jgi:bacteriocin biosynthesis cyclodehydratase domain-containing protein
MDGHCATVGPTVLPRETACFHCYTTRVKANTDHPEALQAYEDHLMTHGNNAVFGYLPPHIQTLAGLAALDVIKDLSGLTPPLTYNAQLEMNLLNMEFELHPVLRLPRCPSCSRLVTSGAVVRPFMERVA